MVRDPERSPALYQYLRQYQKDPASRVFAPLAEAYRKAGLIDEAIEIAREGLRIHPRFTGGRVALARALFDKKDYAAVSDELKAVVQDAPDNLAAQKLYAESNLMLGRVAEALSAYKMYLFYHPYDTEIAKMVLELETQSYENGVLVLDSTPPRREVDQYQVRPLREVIAQDPLRRQGDQIRKIEWLQGLLLRVERYRNSN